MFGQGRRMFGDKCQLIGEVEKALESAGKTEKEHVGRNQCQRA